MAASRSKWGLPVSTVALNTELCQLPTLGRPLAVWWRAQRPRPSWAPSPAPLHPKLLPTLPCPGTRLRPCLVAQGPPGRIGPKGISGHPGEKGERVSIEAAWVEDSGGPGSPGSDPLTAHSIPLLPPAGTARGARPPRLHGTAGKWRWSPSSTPPGAHRPRPLPWLHPLGAEPTTLPGWSRVSSSSILAPISGSHQPLRTRLPPSPLLWLCVSGPLSLSSLCVSFSLTLFLSFSISPPLVVDLSVCPFSLSSLVAQVVKRLPALQETRVRSLGWKDPLEKEMATHSSILAWRIPWTEEPGRLQSVGSQRGGHNWTTSLSLIWSIYASFFFFFLIYLFGGAWT